MPLARKLAAEFIGTFWLVLGGCGQIADPRRIVLPLGRPRKRPLLAGRRLTSYVDSALGSRHCEARLDREATAAAMPLEPPVPANPRFAQRHSRHRSSTRRAQSVI